MVDRLRELVARHTNPVFATNVAREYLQARILESLQRSGAMVPLAFHGGTALRFLYAIPRYSEDLDFALEQPDASYAPEQWLRALRASLERETYTVEIKASLQRVVHSAFIRFRGLPFELSLSPHTDAVLAVKLEVDTRPPAGAVLSTTIVRHHVTLQLQHHDRGSLLAGTLHAVLQRPYVKGRDLYDLLWYLGDRTWPGPNLMLLNAALTQTGWKRAPLDEPSWRAVVRDRLEALDWRRVVADVEPFLEEEDAAGLLTLDNLVRLLEA